MAVSPHPLSAPRSFAAVANPVLAARAASPTPDEVFSLVDGRQLSVGGRQWTIEVFGIRDVADGRWVQAGLACDGESMMVTRRLRPGAGPQHVILTLASWLAQPKSVAGSDSFQHVA